MRPLKLTKKGLKDKSLHYGDAFGYTWVSNGYWVVRSCILSTPLTFEGLSKDQLQQLAAAIGASQCVHQESMEDLIRGEGAPIQVYRSPVLFDTRSLWRLYASEDATDGVWLGEDYLKWLQKPELLWLIGERVRDTSSSSDATFVLAAGNLSDAHAGPGPRWCALRWG